MKNFVKELVYQPIQLVAFIMMKKKKEWYNLWIHYHKKL